MRPYELTKQEGDKLLRARFFDYFMSHYTEENGSSDFAVRDYVVLGRSKDELIKEYQELGYAE